MRLLFPLLLALTLLSSCTEGKEEIETTPVSKTQAKKVFTEGSVFVDNEFDGARLNDFKQLNDSTYQALITPENVPVNNSPWFSFRIWSEEATKIRLEIAYGEEYKHRYVPKLSADGTSWKPMEQDLYLVDTVTGKLMIELTLSPQKLWVSAQENLNSAYIHSWMDSLAQSAYISKEEVGKSVLGQPISLLKVKNGAPKYSIIVIGRQHPPEVPGGTISLVSFVQTVLSDSDLANSFRERFEMLVFPLLNPDGVDNGNWRHNANGKDLNRDWEAFSQPETRAVKDWLTNAENISRSGKYCFGIDFHTSFSGPYLLTLDTIPHKVKPELTTKWINQIESETKQELDIRPRAQTLPYCYNWMINALEIEAVTYEEGDEIDRAIVKQRAKDYANVLMKVLLEKYG